MLVVGGTRAPLGAVALRLRHAAPGTRIVVLADDEAPPHRFAALNIEVLRPPLDVNALMRGLWPAA